jgi:hypothetical protein
MDFETKNQASLKLEKLKKGPSRRKRRKRELVDLEIPVESEEQAESLVSSMHVRGSESWAKLTQGSVKLVKRVMPPEVPAHA